MAKILTQGKLCILFCLIMAGCALLSFSAYLSTLKKYDILVTFLNMPKASKCLAQNFEGYEIRNSNKVVSEIFNDLNIGYKLFQNYQNKLKDSKHSDEHSVNHSPE